MAKLKANNEFISDKTKNPVVSSEYVKHGTGWLKDTVDNLSTESAGKASKTYVDTELAKKVDKVSGKGLSTNDYTTAEKTKLAGIAEGANKTVIDAALSSTSTNPVQNKAVYAGLAGKADQSYVEDNFALHSSRINAKASQTSVDAIEARVSTNETNIAANSARMDTFTTLTDGSTTGDAELADGRVGTDGTTYTNIGGAIRGQINQLKSEISDISPEYISEFAYSIPMEIGALDGYGREIPGDTRARATVFLPFLPGLNIVIPEGYKARLVVFTNDAFSTLSSWHEEKYINVDDFVKNKNRNAKTTFRLLVGKTNDSVITGVPDIYYVSNKVENLSEGLKTDRIRVILKDFAVSQYGPYSQTGYYTSIPVAVEKGIYKCFAIRNYIELDENLNTIALKSGSGGNTIEIASNTVKYIVFCWRGDDAESDFMCFSKSEDFIGGYETNRVTGDSGKYSGKIIIWTGDSIPHGQVGTGTAPTRPYPQIVAENLGMELRNYSIGGSTIAHKSNYGGAFKSDSDFNSAEKDTSKYYQVITGQTYKSYKYSGGSWIQDGTLAQECRTPIVDRYDFMETENVEIVCVAACTNDFQYNWTDIGIVAEVGTTFDRTTFYGALQYLIESLLVKYKGKKIVFCTPIKRAQTTAMVTAPGNGDYPLPTSKNTKNKTLKDYGYIIKEVCELYSIPVIDLYSMSGLNPSLSSQSEFFDSWKTHPYQNGHNLIGEIATAQLRTLIEN